MREIDRNQINSVLYSLSHDELIDLCKKLNKEWKDTDDFLLNITHDLRSPISTILSVLQCLNINKHNIEGEKLDKYLSTIKRNSYKIIKLIDNLIDTERLEKNTHTLQKKNVDVVQLIESTVDSIRAYANRKDLSIIFDTNVEECILGIDPQALDRIVINLLSNAIKFSDRGKNIFVTVLDKGVKFEMHVKDNGPGIKKEDQERIFARFNQSNRPKDSDQVGSGIGLDLVKGLVKGHNGSIELKSQEGKGSEFIVSFPKFVIHNVEEIEENFGMSKIEQLEIEFSDIYF